MKDAVSDFTFRMTGGNGNAARLCAAAVAALEEGSVCLPVGGAERAILEEVPEVAFFADAGTPPDSVATPFVVSGDRLYTRRNWVYERRVRDWVAARAAGPAAAAPDLPDEPFYALLRPEQRAAAAAMCASRFSILTGGPGTGKTHTIARAVAFALAREPDLRLGLAAPTGKAKARMAESLAAAAGPAGFGVPPASTIHSLLGAKRDLVSFRHDRANPLSLDWLIVDEASMVDLPLMAKLLDALPDGCRLTLVGDADQLASVERGRVFGDLCRFPGVPVSRLAESARFPSGGAIARLAAAVNGNRPDEAVRVLAEGSPLVSFADLAALAPADAFDPGTWPGFAAAVDRGFAAFAASGSAAEALERLNGFRVLCALRRGPFGSEALARWIGNRLGRGCPTPLMVTRNDRSLDVENGDVGVVMPGEPGVLHLPGAKAVRTELLQGTELAFASTVHKAQGSEYGDVAVVLPPAPAAPGADGNAFRLLTREILYTAVTRTKGGVRLWASEAAIRHCAEHGVERVAGLAPPV